MTITFHQAELDNGLTIIAEVDPAAMTAAAGIYVQAGARDEASELMGVSHFLEHMMFKGTARRSAEQVNQEFDDIGANYNAFTSHEMTAFWAHVLPEYLDRAEDVLCDILRPSLRQDDFDAEKSVILEEIAMYADHPFWVLYEASMERYYATHPLRHRVLGTRQTIQNMTRVQMQAYFDHKYSPDNMVMALAGNLDFEERVAAIEKRCGNWKRTGANRMYPVMTLGSDTFTEQSPKINRHYMLMIAPGPAVQDDDRYAATILSQILGDSDGSRLYWSLVDTGIADEAQAQYDGRDGVGEFYTYASCSPERASEAESIILKDNRELIPSISEDDLVRVRSRIATSVTLAGERPAGRMRRLGNLWTYQRIYRPLEDELARINGVTIDDLRGVAERYPLAPIVTGHLTPAS